MIIKTKIIIIIGICNALVHLFLYIISFEGISIGFFLDGYSIFMALFFTLWAVMQLILIRQMARNGGINSFDRGKTLFGKKNPFSQTKYYSSQEKSEEVMRRLQYNLSNTNIVYKRIDDSEFVISTTKENRVINPEITIRVFNEVDKTSYSTSLEYINNYKIPFIKLILAGLIIMFTYFGMIAIFPVVLIHFYSMVEQFQGQPSINNDLRQFDKILSDTI